MATQDRVEHVENQYGRYICQECDGCGARVLSTVEWMVTDGLDKCPRCGHPDSVAWPPSLLESVLNHPTWKTEYNDALELVEQDGASVIFNEEVYRITRIESKEGDT